MYPANTSDTIWSIQSIGDGMFEQVEARFFYPNIWFQPMRSRLRAGLHLIQCACWLEANFQPRAGGQGEAFKRLGGGPGTATLQTSDD